MSKTNSKTEGLSNSAVVFSEVEVPQEVREQISSKVEELKKTNGIRKVFVVVVAGDADDDKPMYIAYLRRPNLMHFSQYMNFVQKDLVQANKMLVNNIFLAGDRELIEDDELFLYGTMQQLSGIIDSRQAEMVKL